MLNPEIEGRIRNLERRAKNLVKEDGVSIEEHGEVLNDARHLFLRQIQVTCGPMVEGSEALAAFPSNLAQRLEELILWLESAYDGEHDDELDLMQNGSVKLDPRLKEPAKMWRREIEQAGHQIRAFRASFQSPRI